jgi:hypothetical protein
MVMRRRYNTRRLKRQGVCGGRISGAARHGFRQAAERRVDEGDDRRLNVAFGHGLAFT